ncbi:hypothetical protein MF406_16700 [Georgenia sp. TF02-10]|uniref:hypothetical protein n=1 Tax=Georgenia sp. TF02-10 TaxID=2917725 RepID=UPI001FA6FACB|nr:hypothetical protein [Georgenia sp. TF02-10]UNX54505.1 hypothetical protein MF406_16700 [Georgenia sp. TF02-10]
MGDVGDAATEPRDLVGHWRSAGFREHAGGWVGTALAGAGLQVRGPLTEHRVRFWSAVFTVATDHGRVWFKVTNPGQRFEAGLVRVLADLLPGEVLAPLAVDAERGWLLLPDGGPTLRERGAVTEAEWEALVVQAARMQAALATHRRALLGAGLPVLLPGEAVEYVTGVVEELAALPREDPQRLDGREARDLLAGLAAVGGVFADLAAGGVPLTLQPNDLSPANALGPYRADGGADHARDGAGPFRLFDLGDAFWSHPFAVLQVPTRMAAGSWPHRPRPGHGLAARLRRAYVAQWAGLPRGRDGDHLLDAADRLASLHRCESWRRLLRHADPARLGTPTPRLATWLADAIRPPGHR